jgi:hypothetical protein
MLKRCPRRLQPIRQLSSISVAPGVQAFAHGTQRKSASQIFMCSGYAREHKRMWQTAGEIVSNLSVAAAAAERAPMNSARCGFATGWMLNHIYATAIQSETVIAFWISPGGSVAAKTKLPLTLAAVGDQQHSPIVAQVKQIDCRGGLFGAHRRRVA